MVIRGACFEQIAKLFSSRDLRVLLNARDRRIKQAHKLVVNEEHLANYISTGYRHSKYAGKNIYSGINKCVQSNFSVIILHGIKYIGCAVLVLFCCSIRMRKGT